MHSCFLRSREHEDVEAAAEQMGVELKRLTFDPLALPAVKHNAPDRCFWCKRRIFLQFNDCAQARGIETVIDGTNADDLKTYRPGLAALKELHVLSPLAELGITKTQVRQLAAEMQLECASKPSMPCMATRFAYGTLLTEELVQKAIAGEDLVRKTVPEAGNVRLRIHGEIARIEVPKEFIAEAARRHDELASGLKNLGFRFATLDLDGFRSGSMDSVNL